MALNEGERQALLTQVTRLVEYAETKIQRLGLPHVKVGVWDGRTKQPISDPQHLIDMAEGKPPAALRGVTVSAAPEPDPGEDKGNGGE